MKALYLLVMLFAASRLANSSEIPNLPIYPLGGSFDSFIDDDGCIRPLILLGDIDFGSGLKLPLVLNFSSAVRPPSPEFGQGWDCPLFEAKVFDVQQGLKKVELLGGKHIYLIHNPRTDTWKHYYSGHWTGRVKGNDFELVYDSLYTFEFHNGLISSLTLPSGRTVLWNREGQKVVSMGEAGKSPAMEIVYDKVGFAKQILLQPDGLGKAKGTYNLTSNLVYAGTDGIQCPNGRVIGFNRSLDKVLNSVVSWTDTKGFGANLTWDSKTGKILSDDRYDYRMQGGNDGNSFPQMFRTSKITKITESYFFDRQHGITEQTFADGTLRHTEASQAPGPNYKQVRLIQETRNGITKLILRRSFDEAGHLLRDVTGLTHGKEVVRQYVYDDAGRVTSFFLNGKKQWENVYDPVTGQLKERDLPNIGMKLAFNPLPGGDVKELVEKSGGKITTIQKLASNEWQAKAALLEEIH